jgi:hypothetical protein
MQTSVDVLSNPVRVNDPIRYTIRVVNDTNVPDSQVDIQINVPFDSGVKVENIVPLTNPEQPPPEIKNGRILLPYVPRLAPGEAAEYSIVLSSNQPQTFPIDVMVRSDNNPGGYAESASTTVLP